MQTELSNSIEVRSDFLTILLEYKYVIFTVNSRYIEVEGTSILVRYKRDFVITDIVLY